VAAHAYPLDWLRFELMGVFGNELGFNSVGVRPVAIVDLGWLKVKLAGEWRKLENQEEGRLQWEEKRGAGGGVQLHFLDLTPVFGLSCGANGAYGVVDRVDPFGTVNEEGSPDTLSAGGFANLRFWSAILGLGYQHTIEGDRHLNDQTGDEGAFTHQQGFVSVRHPIVFPWLQAKLVGAWARADLAPAFDNPRVNDMWSVRLRLSMVF